MASLFHVTMKSILRSLLYQAPVHSLSPLNPLQSNLYRIETYLKEYDNPKSLPLQAPQLLHIEQILYKYKKKLTPDELHFHNKLLNQVEFLLQRKSVSSMPTRAYLELTNACNLKCPICGQSMFEGKRSFFSDTLLPRIAEVFPYLDELCLAGFGETMVYPSLQKVIEMIPEYVPIRIISNGLLLTPQRIEPILNRLNSLWISFEAMDEEIYASIRGQKGLMTLLDNIKHIQQYKEQEGLKTPEIHLCFVAMRKNIEILPAYIRQASDLGAKSVNVNYLMVFTKEWKDQSLLYHQDLANSIFQECEELAEKLGIDLHLPGYFDTSNTEKKDFFCKEPWEFAYFNAQGGIGPCCTYSAQFGDLTKQSFREIWDGPKYQAFRQIVNHKENRPKICRKCVFDRNQPIDNEERHLHLIDKNNQLVPDNE